MNLFGLLLLCIYLVPGNLWAAPEVPPVTLAWPLWVAFCLVGLGLGWLIGRRTRTIKQPTPLDASQRRLLDGILEHSSLPIYTKNLQGRYQSANLAFTSLVQKSSDDIIGKTAFDLFNQENAATIQAQDQSVLHSGELMFFAAPLVIQGKTHHLEYRIFPLHDKQGKVVGLCGIARDTTDHKELLSALSASEDSFRQLFERHGSYFWLVDPATRLIVRANPSCAKFHGLTPEEMAGLPLSHFSKLDPSKALERIEKIKTEGKARFLSPHLLADGSLRTVEVHSSMVLFDGRELIFSVMHDMTEQLEAQRQQKESEARFELLAEAAQEPILILDGDHLFDANRAAQRHFGLSHRELIEKPLEDLLPGLGSMKPATHRRLHGQKNGRVFHWEINAAALPFQGKEHLALAINDQSQLWQQQEDLKENHRLMQAVIDAVPAPVLLCDPNGKVKTGNFSFLQLLNLPVESAEGQPLSQLLEPHLAKRLTESIHGPRDFEVSFADAQGCRLSFFCSQAPLLDLGGSLQGVVTVLFDITQRKTALKNLEKTREQLNRILAGSRDGYWELEPASGQLFLSEQAKTLLGRSGNARIAPWGLPQAEQDQLKAQINQLLESKDKELQWLVQLTDREGTPQWLLFKALAFYEQGKPRFLSGVVSDLTLYKKTESQLAESKQRLDLALEAGRLGFWDWLPQSDHLSVNQRWAEMLGYGLLELPPKGSFWFSRLNAKDLRLIQAELTKLNRGESQRFALKVQLKHKEGQQIWALIQGQVMSRDDQGQPLRLVGTQQDITEEVETNEGLTQAKAAAEVAVRAKAEFLANMSHEIRTPMNAVLGFAELLRGQIHDPLGRSYLESIQRGGKSLLRLINDLLDLSKIESGKMAINREPTNLVQLFEEVNEIFSPRFEQKGVELALDMAEEVPRFVLIDDLRLRQVLFNLIGNAVKFTEAGRVTVRVRATHIDSTLLRFDLNIDVIDTGIGISAERIYGLFDLFNTAQAPASSTQGTGLGLAITSRLIQAMHGTLKVDSQPGKGSRFTIELPEVSLIKRMDSSLGAEAPVGQNIRYRQGTVLVVDDVESNRSLVREALRNTGLSVREAEDGQQALILAEAILPDLILMDLRMPVLGGVEATKQLRDLPMLKKTPVIAMTASVATPQRFVDSGLFDALLIKPVRIERLYELVARFLAHHEPKASPAAIPAFAAFEQVKGDDWGLLVAQYQQTIESRNFDQITSFADKLMEVGQAQDNETLKNYAERMHFLAGNFDIEKLQVLLAQFHDLPHPPKNAT
ncbi:MAG: PAS domain S-box protein [bacterium]|nr:PAS domain S-box protein [bacterium]